MISVAPSVPPVSVHRCQLSVHINAIYQCPSECPSELSVPPISASQYHLSMPISATYQCCQSVPPISQCQSVLPI
ncbi:unnamed protein product, partial [Staurois parvus]